jgi:predicted phosphodiesterase
MKFCKLSILVLLLSLCFGSFSAYGQHSHHQNGLHHWELPSKDPDRIILTFNGDPATSRAVTWRTDTTVTKAVAQIAVAKVNSSFKETASSQEATTETFDLGLYKRNQSYKVHYHSTVFEGLAPDTQYVYRVGDGDQYWSEWIQFRTAKKEYARTQFVYFGDAQNNVLEHWSRVIRKAYQTAPDASFVIHAGDLINDAHKDQEWAEWYKAGGFIHSQWTAIPVVGNHEFWHLKNREGRMLSIQWRPQFTLPVEEELDPKLHETVYTVDYQDVRIIVLNSNDLLEEQTEYVRKQLESSTAKWTILTCHHSIFAPAVGRDFQFARENWKPLLDQYNVDLVLNGHDHTYARGHVPFRFAEKGPNEDLGTVYVTSVSGPKQYDLDKDQLEGFSNQGYQLDQTGEQTQFYQVITVEDNKLTYVAYNALGEEHDRIVIKKNFKSGKKKLVD